MNNIDKLQDIIINQNAQIRALKNELTGYIIGNESMDIDIYMDLIRMSIEQNNTEMFDICSPFIRKQLHLQFEYSPRQSSNPYVKTFETTINLYDLDFYDMNCQLIRSKLTPQSRPRSRSRSPTHTSRSASTQSSQSARSARSARSTQMQTSPALSANALEWDATLYHPASTTIPVISEQSTLPEQETQRENLRQSLHSLMQAQRQARPSTSVRSGRSNQSTSGQSYQSATSGSSVASGRATSEQFARAVQSSQIAINVYINKT